MDFRNAVIVMTSNLGSQHIQEIAERQGLTPEAFTQMKAAVMASVQSHFRPEFINRLDDIVVFHPLTSEHIRAIAKIQTLSLAKRLADRGLKLELTERALDLLGTSGFDPVYGARPLKRAIQQLLENPLANKILQGAFISGDVIHVDADASGLLFKN